ncbi:MAG: class B sortase [Clostridia bacterium]|nr:class B sortase [Clostridia bacterium]
MVTKKEVKKSVGEMIRKIILGIAIIVLVGTSAYLINAYVIEPFKHHQNGDDTTVTDEDNTGTTKLDGSNDTIQAKYSALLKINPDFVGKLYIEAIEEAGFNVVQAEDNDKYLNLGFKGETTRYGTLFVDYRNNIKEFNTNTIIYGHNMRDGSQLGSLSIYSDIENYKAYPTIEFNTIYRNYTWKVFAAFISNGDKSQDNGYEFPYLTTNFPSEAKFLEFIDEVKSRSYYINEAVDIKPGDKILTLSTCDTVFEDARFVVMARLVRDGESAEVDTSKAKINENQRFPQAWYDAKDDRNPFKNADKYTID